MSDKIEHKNSSSAGPPTQETREINGDDRRDKVIGKGVRKFGTFGGVFVPTILTILGLILYLRTGWVVGNAGLLGAFAIILIAFVITGFTGLSMSSFVTNIRIGGGGAFSMISQSLGLEVGGSIGIPLYLSQAFVVALYIFGFRSGWLWIFPHHPAILVDVAIFILIIGITFISTRFAIKIQYIILVIIAISLVSIAIAAFQGSMKLDPVLWGDFPGAPENGFPGTTFWVVFAVFFPASTGIMAGVNMSGELKDPRKSIPVGMMSAIGLSFVIYIALAYWLSTSATVEELLNNYTIAIDRAYWGPAVLAGLLSATFSSGLASFVGAPRILQALGERNILPFGGWFSKMNKKDEPINATYITAGIVFLGLMVRDLNAIAPLVTMFFLITYSSINLIVFIEQSLGLLSFRPTFRLPRIVPFIGLVGCLFAMFIVNPTIGLIAVAVVVGIYGLLMRRHLKAPFGDVRSGLFLALAEWAAKIVMMMKVSGERAWKPNIIVPTDDPNKILGMYRLIYDIAHPVGSVKLMGIVSRGGYERMERRLIESEHSLQREGVFTTYSVVESDNLAEGVINGIQSISASFFRPNLLFQELIRSDDFHSDLKRILFEAKRQNMGMGLFVEHRNAGLGLRRRINLWVPDRSPDWDGKVEFDNLNLAILLAYRLTDSWNGFLNLVTTVEKKDDIPRAHKYLERLVVLARLPANTGVYLEDENFSDFSHKAPQADLDIFPLRKDFDVEFMYKLVDLTESSCLFTKDGGNESALA